MQWAAQSLLEALIMYLLDKRFTEKAMATHSSTLAWKIPWTEEPGRLQSMGSLRVRHDWMTSLSLSCIGEGNGNPLQCSCLENPRDGGAWWAAVYGVSQSRTWLKRLSSSSGLQRAEISCSQFWRLEFQGHDVSMLGEVPLPGHKLPIVSSHGRRSEGVPWGLL